MSTETEWRDLPGYEGLYRVSSTGGVFSVRLQREQKPTLSRKYYVVGLRDRNGKDKLWFLHRLVLMAFVGPRPDKQQGAHLDGNPENNAATNLIWATAKENNSHKYAHGTHLEGERAPWAKLTENQIIEMCEKRRQGAYVPALSEEYGISVGAVSMITQGKLWRSARVVDRTYIPLRGERTARAELTEADVVAIRRALAAGQTCRGLGREYGVSHNAISNIKLGRTWAHVPQGTTGKIESPIARGSAAFLERLHAAP